MKCLEMGPKSKYKVHYVSYAPYAHSLKIILDIIFVL